jgi:heme iron utilization protein
MPNDHARPISSHEDPTRPAVREPSHAERCRTLAEQARFGTLSTVARDPQGYPFGSLVTIAVDTQGRLLFLLSSLAEHTMNLKAKSECSVLLTEPIGSHAQPLALGRVTILGRASVAPSAETAAVREAFLAKQPSASYYVDFRDFAFFRLEPEALRYVGGFGRMSWVDAADYCAAEPDPLLDATPGILAHMNTDHADASLSYARVLCGLPEATAATMTGVDRYGFDLAVTTPSGPRSARLAFDEPVRTSDEVRRRMIELVKRARG